MLTNTLRLCLRSSHFPAGPSPFQQVFRRAQIRPAAWEAVVMVDALRTQRKKQLNQRYNIETVCEIGKELPRNLWLNTEQRGPEKRFRETIYSVCQSQQDCLLIRYPRTSVFYQLSSLQCQNTENARTDNSRTHPPLFPRTKRNGSAVGQGPPLRGWVPRMNLTKKLAEQDVCGQTKCTSDSHFRMQFSLDTTFFWNCGLCSNGLWTPCALRAVLEPQLRWKHTDRHCGMF